MVVQVSGYPLMLYIKISYKTGNTFESSGETLTLDHAWTDPTIVVENMKRIWDHYNWYSAKNSAWLDPVPAPEWQARLSVKEYDYQHYQILLKDDNGTEFELSRIFWIGYFETLVEVSVTMNKP